MARAGRQWKDRRPLIMRAFVIALFIVASLVVAASAHEVRPAYLELRETAPGTYSALWKVPAQAGNLRLGIYVKLPADTRQLSEPRGQMVGGAYLERWEFARDGGLAGQVIRIDGLASTRSDALIRFTSLDGASQTHRATPDNPQVSLAAVASQWSVAGTYTVLGIEHILLGIDHLLFVFALVLLVKSRRKLVGTITTFTVAHSITLAAATLGFMHVPGPPVEACIALSIVFVAAEIVHRRTGRRGITERWPWVVSFVFGLLHGLGFAGALSEVGLPQQAIPLALLFFNIGVELGQLAFIAILLAAIATLHRLPLRWPDWGWRLAPYAIGSVAALWVIERTAAFY
jgi:hydrogenase/urease accessory protein HupE